MKNHINKAIKTLLWCIYLLGYPSFVSAFTSLQDATAYQDEPFDAVIDRNLALHQYAHQAAQSTGKEREKYLIKFFNAFPRDFETYFKMEFPCYGNTVYFYNKDDMNVSLVENLFKNPWSRFFPVLCVVDKAEDIPKEKPSPRFKDFDTKAYRAGYFPRLGEHIPYSLFHDLIKVIPKELYYQKLVSIQIGSFDCLYRVNGSDDDDNVVDRLTAYKLWVQKILPPFIYQPGDLPKGYAERYGLIESRPDLLDPKENDKKTSLPPQPDLMVMKILSEKTDQEVLSYWYGYYRGGGNLKLASKQLAPLYPRLAKLMIQAGDQILADVQKGHEENPGDCHCFDPIFY